MGESNSKKTFNGMIWSLVENFSLQGIQFIIGILVARVLSPSDYGMVGMLAIFTAIAQTLINSGFSTALIRKTDRTQTDLSTTFYFNGLKCIDIFRKICLSLQQSRQACCKVAVL